MNLTVEERHECDSDHRLLERSLHADINKMLQNGLIILLYHQRHDVHVLQDMQPEVGHSFLLFHSSVCTPKKYYPIPYLHD